LQALLALIVALGLQIAVNYSNDYSDGIRGTDDVRVGPIRLTASGLASAKAVKRAAFLSFGVACVAGLLLASISSWWILIVGAISVLAAWGYTGGHTPYGYRGFGELSVFTFFGVVATVGTYYVQTLEFSTAAFAASVSMGSLSCALLVLPYIFAPLTGNPLAFLTLASAPHALAIAREIRAGATGEALIPLLGRTGQLQLHFSLTFAIALSF
jgi:1,4-dihydroxy-2-naphthoate octaprenyltransferase